MPDQTTTTLPQEKADLEAAINNYIFYPQSYLLVN